jgi:hypothetical protein
MRRLTPAIAVALLVVVTACSGESSDGSSSAPPERTSTTKPDRPERNDPGCRYIVASDGKRSMPGPPELEYLADAVVEPTDCYDKISFTFEQGNNPDVPPGYTVEYRQEPYVEVGGEQIPNSTTGFEDANAVLYVEFTPTSTYDGREPGAGRDTYNGNLRLLFDSEKVHHTAIVEWVQQYPDVTPEVPTDNKVVWLIGLDEKRPFTVDAAATPPRVNILVMR